MWSLNHTDAVMNLLAAAERWLDLTGDAVTLCQVAALAASPHFTAKQCDHPRRRP